MRIAHARREEMAAIDKAHGGAGPVLFKSLYDKEAFQTDWFFVHSAYLLPGGGIGHHCHDRGEEIFITIDNAAQFTHNGRTAQIEGGAAVPLRMGESHAIYNHTQRETRWPVDAYGQRGTLERPDGRPARHRGRGGVPEAVVQEMAGRRKELILT